MVKNTTWSKFEPPLVKASNTEFQHSNLNVHNIACVNTVANCVKNITPRGGKTPSPHTNKAGPNNRPVDNVKRQKCKNYKSVKLPDPQTVTHRSDNGTFTKCDFKNNDRAHLNVNAKRFDFSRIRNKGNVSHTSEGAKSQNNYENTFKNKFWPLGTEENLNPKSHCHEFQTISKDLENKVPHTDCSPDKGTKLDQIPVTKANDTEKVPHGHDYVNSYSNSIANNTIECVKHGLYRGLLPQFLSHHNQTLYNKKSSC